MGFCVCWRSWLYETKSTWSVWGLLRFFSGRVSSWLYETKSRGCSWSWFFFCFLRNHAWSRHERESWCLISLLFFFLAFWCLRRCHEGKSISRSSRPYLLCYSLWLRRSRRLYERKSRSRCWWLSFISCGRCLWLGQEGKARCNWCWIACLLFFLFGWFLINFKFFSLSSFFFFAVTQVIYYLRCLRSPHIIFRLGFNRNVVVASRLIIVINTISWYQGRITCLLICVIRLVFIFLLVLFFQGFLRLGFLIGGVVKERKAGLYGWLWSCFYNWFFSILSLLYRFIIVSRNLEFSIFFFLYWLGWSYIQSWRFIGSLFILWISIIFNLFLFDFLLVILILDFWLFFFLFWLFFRQILFITHVINFLLVLLNFLLVSFLVQVELILKLFGFIVIFCFSRLVNLLLKRSNFIMIFLNEFHHIWLAKAKIYPSFCGFFWFIFYFLSHSSLWLSIRRYLQLFLSIWFRSFRFRIVLFLFHDFLDDLFLSLWSLEFSIPLLELKQFIVNLGELTLQLLFLEAEFIRDGFWYTLFSLGQTW